MPTSMDDPMPFKPAYYWDEQSGLKDDPPFYVKLVTQDTQRRAIPTKSPAIFAFTVGYTLPFQYTSQQVFWRVIPADVELRTNQLIFVPMPKENEIKSIRPPKPEPDTDKDTPRKPKRKPEEPPQTKPQDPAKPTYVVQYLPLQRGNKTRPPVKLGVTFLTLHGNHRVLWDVRPSSETLASGVLFLDPYEDKAEARDVEAAASMTARLQRLLGG